MPRFNIKKILFLASVFLVIYFALMIYRCPLTDPSEIRVAHRNVYAGFEQSSQAYLEIILEVFLEVFQKITISSHDYDLILEQPFGKFDEMRNRKDQENGKKIIFYTGENVEPKPDKYDLSIGFSHISHSKYLRMPLYYNYHLEKVSVNYKRPTCNPNKKFFACFLASNGNHTLGKVQYINFFREKGDEIDYIYDGVIHRDNFFKALSKYKFVASGGKHLNNIGYTVKLEDTHTWLSDCKFTIAFENRRSSGYVTEKAFYPYFSGSIPIYLGAPDFQKDINPKSVVDVGSFASFTDAIAYLKKLDQDDDQYCQMYQQTIVPRVENNYEYKYSVLREKLLVILKEIKAHKQKQVERENKRWICFIKRYLYGITSNFYTFFFPVKQ